MDNRQYLPPPPGGYPPPAQYGQNYPPVPGQQQSWQPPPGQAHPPSYPPPPNAPPERQAQHPYPPPTQAPPPPAGYYGPINPTHVQGAPNPAVAPPPPPNQQYYYPPPTPPQPPQPAQGYSQNPNQYGQYREHGQQPLSQEPPQPHQQYQQYQQHQQYYPPPPPPPPAQPAQPTTDSRPGNYAIPRRPVGQSQTPSSSGGGQYPVPDQLSTGPVSYQSPPPPPTTAVPGAGNYPAPPAQPPRPGQNNGAPPQTDPVADISSHFSRVAINDSRAVPPPQRQPASQDPYDDEPLQKLSVVRDSGEPNEVLHECTEFNPVDYETAWHFLPDAPDFLICTRCFYDHLSRTPFAPSFRKERKPSGVCRFHLPRILKSLLPDALRTNDMAPLREYIRHRMTIPDCAGPAGVIGDPKNKWFSPSNPGITGFACCEACHADYILGTAYASHFVPCTEEQKPEDRWSCDLSNSFTRRSLARYAGRGEDWSKWVAGAAKRFALPACDGKAVPASSRKWLKARSEFRGLETLAICETCYYDKIALTRFENFFEVLEFQKPKPGFTMFGVALGIDAEVQQEPQVSCDIEGGSMAPALGVALGLRDFSIFHRAAAKVLSCPPCAAEGIKGGVWYSLAPTPVPEFDVCAGCVAGIFEPLGLGRFLAPVHVNPEEVRLCNFNRKAPRFLFFLLRLSQAISEGVWEPFAATVRTWAAMPACPRAKLRKGLKWFGFDDLTICPECWQDFAIKTPLASHVVLQGTVMSDLRMCCLYSPKMRAFWNQACQATPSPKDGIPNLINASRERMKVYQQTYLPAQSMKQMLMMQHSQAMTAGFVSTMYHGMDGLAQVNNFGGGGQWGNGSIGWHDTRYGAQGAQQFQNMLGGFNRVQSGWPAVLALEKQWESVE